MSLKDRLRNFDTQQTVQSEFRVYTVQGAILSVVTVALIMYLVITEAYFNFQVTLQERVHVNATSPSGLELEFDISLPMVPCKNLNIDANDPAGQMQTLHLDRKHHVWKHRMRLTTDGRRVLIGRKTKLEQGSTLVHDKELLAILETAQSNKSNKTLTNKEEDDEDDDVNNACGDCYGAGEQGECCNTCDDVIRAYKRKGWIMTDRSTIKQCVKADLDSSASQDGEGCNVHGIVALDSGGGNLHIAPGRGSGEQASDLLDMLFESFQKWNVSHTIHKIRFGNEYPAAVNQLDGETRTITDSYGMYQYYFQVVPTLYRFLNGTTIQTNQYSVTEHLRHVNPGAGRGLPGVFFFYEVSPLHVEITESYAKGWTAFFTSVCAVIGGVVSVMGLLDQYLYTRKSNGGSSSGSGGSSSTPLLR